jgi:membrane associated rhomboid family serine protease
MPTAPRSGFVAIWFVLDAILALFPPVYWVAGGPTPLIAGIPCSVAYFGVLSAFIVGSLIAAYIDDERRGAFRTSL